MKDVTPAQKDVPVSEFWKDKEFPDYLYRYEDSRYSRGIDSDGDISRSSPIVKVDLKRFPVIRLTPQGAWIRLFEFIPFNEEDKKFVLLTARKKYAALTKEEAIQDFVLRKKRQTQILREQLKNAEIALSKGIEIEKRLQEV